VLLFCGSSSLKTKEFVCLPYGLFRVSESVVQQNAADLDLVNIKCVWVAGHVIRIPSTRYNSLHYTINLVVFNHFWLKPPEAEIDMQKDHDPARPEV
jgi:hypothetical protein